MKGDSSGSARLAAADEALADAVEQHARNERHTEEGQCRLLSRVGASEEHCAGHRAGLGTSQYYYQYRSKHKHGDVTREARTGPAQDVTRVSSSDDTGDDVSMREDNADEHPSSSGSDSRRRITTKREPREVRDAPTSVTEQHVPRRISGKTSLSTQPWLPHGEHWTDIAGTQ